MKNGRPEPLLSASAVQSNSAQGKRKAQIITNINSIGGSNVPQFAKDFKNQSKLPISQLLYKNISKHFQELQQLNQQHPALKIKNNNFFQQSPHFQPSHSSSITPSSAGSSSNSHLFGYSAQNSRKASQHQEVSSLIGSQQNIDKNIKKTTSNQVSAKKHQSSLETRNPSPKPSQGQIAVSIQNQQKQLLLLQQKQSAKINGHYSNNRSNSTSLVSDKLQNPSNNHSQINNIFSPTNIPQNIDSFKNLSHQPSEVFSFANAGSQGSLLFNAQQNQLLQQQTQLLQQQQALNNQNSNGQDSKSKQLSFITYLLQKGRGPKDESSPYPVAGLGISNASKSPLNSRKNSAVQSYAEANNQKAKGIIPSHNKIPYPSNLASPSSSSANLLIGNQQHLASNQQKPNPQSQPLWNQQNAAQLSPKFEISKDVSLPQGVLVKNDLAAEKVNYASGQNVKDEEQHRQNNQKQEDNVIAQTFVQKTVDEPQQKAKGEFYINKNQFSFQFVIGKGGFGKVWRVEQRKTRQVFALKEMSKSLIITKKSVNSVINERDLLCVLKHPFIVNMSYAFQDRDNLYLVMDFMSGGDLRFHIGKQRRFNEEQTRFFVACIFLGLEYLHKNDIIHRDIKPENLVLDDDGYVRVTDLGIARHWKPDNENDTSGTPGYMAPEVMCRQPHTFAVDYFALGVIAFEFMLGRRPYLGRSRQEIRNQILARRVQIKKNEIPEGWSLEAADFINRLIERKPAQRLGINGPDEVKNHPWIRNFPWSKLYSKELKAPYMASKEDNFDFKQQISADDEQTNEIIMQNAMLLRKPQIQSLFGEYNFDNTLFNPNIAISSEHSSSSVSRSTNTSINSKKAPNSIPSSNTNQCFAQMQQEIIQNSIPSNQVAENTIQMAQKNHYN